MEIAEASHGMHSITNSSISNSTSNSSYPATAPELTTYGRQLDLLTQMKSIYHIVRAWRKQLWAVSPQRGAITPHLLLTCKTPPQLEQGSAWH
jgi:hypothetical protein